MLPAILFYLVLFALAMPIGYHLIRGVQLWVAECERHELLTERDEEEHRELMAVSYDTDPSLQPGRL